MLTLLAQNSIGTFGCIGAYCPSSPQDSPGQIEKILTNLFGFLTVVAGLAFLIYFILGAITWITSGGDSGNVEKAKKQMTNAAIGLIAVVATYAITWIVGQVLGISILKPETLINDFLYPNSGGGGGSGTPLDRIAPETNSNRGITE